MSIENKRKENEWKEIKREENKRKEYETGKPEEEGIDLGMGMKNDNLLELEEELSKEQMNRVMNKLREDLKDIEIPDSIMPDNMMNVLEKRLILEKKKTRQKIIKRAFCGMAACLFLGIGVYSYQQSYHEGAYKTVSQEAIQEKDKPVQKNGVEASDKNTKKESETVTQQSTSNSQTGTNSTTEENKKENIQEAVTEDESKGDKEKETQKVQDELSGQEDVRLASDYSDIFKILTKAYRNSYNSYYERDDLVGKDFEENLVSGTNNDASAGNNGSKGDSSSNESDSNSNNYVGDINTSIGVDQGELSEPEEFDYSKTNTVDEQIDEADIVKTDGKYIYTLNKGSNQLEITKVGEKNLSYVYDEVIKSEKKQWALKAMEMYVQNDRMVIISNLYHNLDTDNNFKKIYNGIFKDNTSEAMVEIKRTEMTRIDVYDISNKNEIEKISSKKQDGFYNTSRISDGILYVFTDFFSSVQYNDALKKENIKANEESIPKVDGKKITPSNTYILEDKDANSSFYVVSAWDLGEPENCLVKKAILGQVSQIYVSPNAMYLMKEDWREENGNSTRIIKFLYQDGTMHFKASTGVKGSVDNSFAANESNGYLRVVTHVEEFKEEYRTYTNLYILNNKLKVTGSVKKLAEGEDLYGVRYVKDMAYFVTFEQVDPLFSVDVSDPWNPKVIGKLKIPGFSEYLHLWSDNLLLGIGEEDEYVKLSMFDISDPSKVKEVSKKVIRKGDYTRTTAAGYYKSVCIMPEKNIIGFTLSIQDQEKDLVTEQYVVFSYNKTKGFQKKLTYTNYKKKFYECYEERDQLLLYEENLDHMRGIYIRNEFFIVVPGKEIVRYQLKDYQQLEKYSLQNMK